MDDKNKLVDSKSDAYLIQTKVGQQKSGSFQLAHQVCDSLRLTPIEKDMSQLMTNFQKPRQTVDFDVTAQENDNFRSYSLVQGGSEESESSIDSDDLQNYRYEKRVAKEQHELRDDLFNLFREKQIWTWDQIKARNQDQPE